MRHVIEAASDAAFDRYEEASQRASRYLRGQQIELQETAFAEQREWFGIYLACEREADRLAVRA